MQSLKRKQVVHFDQCCMLFVYFFLFISNSSSSLSCSFHQTQPRNRQGVVILLGKFKSKGMFSFSFPKSTNPTFSNLCFWFLQALGNDSGGKEKGPVESSGGRGREGQRETEEWEGEKEREGEKALEHGTLSLFHTHTHTHTKSQKRLTGWSFKALASLYPSSGVEFQCSISFFIGGLGRARRLGQEECVLFQWSTSVPLIVLMCFSKVISTQIQPHCHLQLVSATL